MAPERQQTYPKDAMLLEIGVIALPIVCFWLLALYVRGCAKV